MRWAADGRALYAIRRHQSRGHLMRAVWPEKTVAEIETGWSWLTDLNLGGETLAVLAERPTHPMVVLTVDTRSGQATPRATSAVGIMGPADLVEPRIITWPAGAGLDASGVFYPAQAADGPRPLMVLVHGGPTSERGLAWEPQAQYFATRGWHVVLLNHRGGSGFGRVFQDQLTGQWGVVDVADARGAAEHLVAAGQADPQRLVITGTSAGGYTTLMALAQDPDFWAAGVSSAGIGLMYDIVAVSHRFEKYYEWTLMGPLPETGALWKERSPLTHVRKVKAPVLLFHGRKDNVVGVQQSIDFAEAVRRRGGVAELVLYDDEGHTFAREATRRDQIEQMERFLDKYVLSQQ
jgi:dipeptidyl aminopeptidase/acylaminoacyl peptidase